MILNPLDCVSQATGVPSAYSHISFCSFAWLKQMVSLLDPIPSDFEQSEMKTVSKNLFSMKHLPVSSLSLLAPLGKH